MHAGGSHMVPATTGIIRQLRIIIEKEISYFHPAKPCCADLLPEEFIDGEHGFLSMGDRGQCRLAWGTPNLVFLFAQHYAGIGVGLLFGPGI